MDEIQADDLSTIRNFLERNLEYVVLLFLLNKPMMGFEIIKSMVKKYGIHVNQGKVYPLLNNLEKKGIIKKIKHGNVKIYSITQKGRGYLNKIVVNKNNG